MQQFIMIFLSLLCASLYGNAESIAHSPVNSHLSDASDDDGDEDIEEADEDIIIMDEDDDDEGVNN